MCVHCSKKSTEETQINYQQCPALLNLCDNGLSTSSSERTQSTPWHTPFLPTTSVAVLREANARQSAGRMESTITNTAPGNGISSVFLQIDRGSRKAAEGMAESVSLH